MTVLLVAAGAAGWTNFSFHGAAFSGWLRGYYPRKPQHKIAEYPVKRQAHFHFTVKDNQPGLRQDIARFFENRQEPDFIDYTPTDHGRIETRKIGTTTTLDDYLDFPHVVPAFVIERESIENSCHYVLDCNYHEDRCRIRAGHSPMSITRLRRFAVGLINSKGANWVAQKIRELIQNTRLVFDYLKMAKNSCAAGCS